MIIDGGADGEDVKIKYHTLVQAGVACVSKSRVWPRLRRLSGPNQPFVKLSPYLAGRFYDLAREFLVPNSGEGFSCAVCEHRMVCHVVNGGLPACGQLPQKEETECDVFRHRSDVQCRSSVAVD